MLKRKNQLKKNYKKKGYKTEDKNRLDTYRNECQVAVECAKVNYISKLGNKLNDQDTHPKSYWKIIHRLMNKSRTPKIPPILHLDKFVLCCLEKAKYFNDFFAKQCTLIVNDSILPEFIFLTDKRIGNVLINDNDILTLIRNLNPNKAVGVDCISGQMLLLCDESVVLPLKIIVKDIWCLS